VCSTYFALGKINKNMDDEVSEDIFDYNVDKKTTPILCYNKDGSVYNDKDSDWILDSSDDVTYEYPTNGTTSTHEMNASRFMAMCETLDRLRQSYNRKVPYKQSEKDYPKQVVEEQYIITHLKFWVNNLVVTKQKFTTQTGQTHDVMECTASDRKKFLNGKSPGSPRKQLPRTIYEAIKSLEEPIIWGNNPTPTKVTVTWIVAYLSKIHPDQSKPNWKYFDCSHRCIEHGLRSKDQSVTIHYACIDSNCLTWETKSDNQARANNHCRNICKHDGICTDWQCKCQQNHNPYCL